MTGGYNENVEVAGNLYHVQTENLGIEKCVVRTVVYDQGSVIAARKTDFSKFKGVRTAAELQKISMIILKKQHDKVVSELRSGLIVKPREPALNIEAVRPPAAAPVAPLVASMPPPPSAPPKAAASVAEDLFGADGEDGGESKELLDQYLCDWADDD